MVTFRDCSPYTEPMFGFLIKKAFFDLWDNFLPAILLNLGFIAVLAIPILLPAALSGFGAVLTLAAFALGMLAAIVYIGGVAGVANEIVQYNSLEWRLFFTSLRTYLPVSLVLGALVIFHVALLMVAIPVYSAMGNMPGLFALAILFWITLIWWLSIQYVMPVRSRLAEKPMQVFKKSFILALDNTVFTLFLALGGIVITLLSFFTAFLIPGIAGLVIWYQAALKLRLYKYDYLEENPGDRGRKIPWDALLYEERERVGKRTLRGMIFPWKE